ncbi:hypothetical protein [Nocardioides sp. AE5]|uniref:WXG100 family type VII secretion target n=1 Tax=Nocardioides sp. AE5 TaxID=2962573 RepID=UPI0028819554|nr:hypothetical protein [Nocardioides sp. AE5]MDT0202222.1 hypothetical protein [Nocardioides sp. AE5]
MTGAGDYQNELQVFWNALPSEVQSVFGFIYNPVNDAIEWVCGDPDDLMRGAAVYSEVGPLITDLAEELATARHAVQGQWEGPDYDAFLTRVTELEDTLASLGEAVGATTEILEAASEAAVESGNAILSIIKMVIAIALSSLVVSLALSVLTFGASMVAWAAGQVANASMALARVSIVTTRMAAFLQRIASLFMRIKDLFLRIKKVLEFLADLVKLLRGMSKGKDIFGAKMAWSERLVWMGVHGGVNAVGKAPINQIPGVQLPGAFGELWGAGESLADAHRAAEEAENV